MATVRIEVSLWSTILDRNAPAVRSRSPVALFNFVLWLACLIMGGALGPSSVQSSGTVVSCLGGTWPTGLCGTPVLCLERRTWQMCLFKFRVSFQQTYLESLPWYYTEARKGRISYERFYVKTRRKLLAVWLWMAHGFSLVLSLKCCLIDACLSNLYEQCVVSTLICCRISPVKVSSVIHSICPPYSHTRLSFWRQGLM